MPTWVNDDGLPVNLGVDEGNPALATEYRRDGPRRYVEVILDSDYLPAVADNSVVLSYTYRLPEGVEVESVEINTTDEFAAGSGTFNLGVTDVDGEGDVTDVDYLIEAATVAELNTGGTNVAGWVGDGVTDSGAAVLTTKSTYLTWEVDTAAILGGKATVRIHYSVPKEQGDSLVWDKSA